MVFRRASGEEESEEDEEDDTAQEVVQAPDADVSPHSFLWALVKHPMTWALLVLCPAGVVVTLLPTKSPTIIFWTNLLAIVPETWLLAIVTEELSLLAGDRASALMNATIGDLVELVFVWLTLDEGLIRVCKGTIVGSMLSNHLVLLGLAFIFAGKRPKTDSSMNTLDMFASLRKVAFVREAQFDRTLALNQAQQLMIATFCVVLPAIFANLQDITDSHVIVLSRALAPFLLISYIAVVTYQIQSAPPLKHGAKSKTNLPTAIALVVGTSLAVVVNSEAMVEYLQEYCEASGLSQSFIGIVLLPLVGDLSHVTSMYFAMKGNMELAVNIAMQSAIQIALVVLPLSIFIGFVLGQPMVLQFPMLETIALLGSAIVTFTVIVDGKSNWLRGTALLTTYTLICVLLYFAPDGAVI